MTELNLKIIRELTIEEKYIYYDKYLEAVLDTLKDLENIGNHIENIRYFIEELKWKDFITKETTIVEIREIIDTFINSYFEHIKNHYLQNMEKNLLIRSIMDCISNITNLFVFSKFFTAFIIAWHITNNPGSVNTIKLVNWILKFILFHRK